MLPRNHPDRIQITFDDHRLVANAGLLLPATLGPAPGPVGTRRPSPRSRQRPGVGQHRRQDDDAGGLRTGWRRLHRRRRCVAHRGDGLHAGRHGQGAIHPPLSRGQALGAFLRGHVRQRMMLTVRTRPPQGVAAPGSRRLGRRAQVAWSNPAVMGVFHPGAIGQGQ